MNPTDPRLDAKLDRVNENLSLWTKKGGLAFGTDAYLLAASLRRNPAGRALELGSGSGIVSLLAATKGKFSEVVALEAQEDLASLCACNVEENHLGDRMRVLCADLREVKENDCGGLFDAVFSNPPYMKVTTGKRNEDDGKFAARHEVRGDITDFCACAARLLKYGGLFTVVWRPDRASDLFAALRQNRLEPKKIALVYADAQTPPCALLVESKLGGGASALFAPPLLLYRDGKKGEPRVLSEQAEKIYADCQYDFT